MFYSVLLASLLVMLASLSGKLLTWRIMGPFIERNLHFFVSFAAGVLLVIAYHLSEEIVEHTGSLAAGMPWIVAGALVVLVGLRYLPDFHHHHAPDADHSHSRIDAKRMLVSDGIHNIGDGVVIVAAFSASPMLGVVTTVSIVIHEMLQEISEFFVLRQAGLSVRQALLYNFAASSTILIGAIGSYFLLDAFESLTVPLLGLAAGSYLIVVFHDLLPHSLTSAHTRAHYAKHAVLFIIGTVLMYGISAALPHEEHEEDESSHAAEVQDIPHEMRGTDIRKESEENISRGILRE